MARISIPIDALTSRLNLGGGLDGIRSQSVMSRFNNIRPISEFFDVRRISKPANFGDVQTRLNYNLGYFASNYLAVFVMLTIYSLITNPVLLFVIVLSTAGIWGIKKLGGQDLELGTTRVPTSTLYTVLLIIVIPLTIYAGPVSSALWLIGASGVCVFGHASLMDRPIENAFSEEAV